MGFGHSLLSNQEGGVFAKGISRKEMKALELTKIFPSISLPQDISADGDHITVGDAQFVIRKGKVKNKEHIPDIGQGRFLAIGASGGSEAQVQIISEIDDFVEAVNKNANEFWVVYNDGHLDCQVIPSCAGTPKLFVLGEHNEPVAVRTGNGTLNIKSAELTEKLTLMASKN
ncbi:hypothetical protein ROA7450_03476 [Roseovarius albus]|uniref:Uncharacterized protein n=1 Tax=Roseovarius albus TaxID=1247867 RepID=A0A1X6ZYW4_9RHOB|nr:hypothetical protein [Roseovarius albus]SLN65645.1 hypothetical protein ROA7450_03476 [Roseovarius albus]